MRNVVSKRLAAAAVVVAVGVSGLAGGAGAQSDSAERANLYTVNYTMQNYFSDGQGGLIPFFEEQSGQINQGIEIRQSDGYIYSFNFTRSTILMRWNQSSEFDFFEPFVGAAAGLTQEQAAASGIEDRYVIEFDEPVGQFDVVASERMALTPIVRVIDDYTIEIAIPGGTTIGDGYNATIVFS